MKRPWKLLLVVAVSVLVASASGCADGGPPQPGFLYVELLTPNTDDAAVRLRIIGEGMSDLQAVPGYQLYSRARASSDSIEVAVVGELTGGDLLKFMVPDVNGGYAASLVEVASTTNALREPLTGYSLQLYSK
jgi:hypothetical protein